MKETLKLIKEELQKVLTKDEIIVDEVTFTEKGKYRFLQVVLDKVGGIDLETIVEATKKVNKVVDKIDITTESYILDVISKERG